MVDAFQLFGIQRFRGIDRNSQQRPLHLFKRKIDLSHLRGSAHLHRLAVKVGPAFIRQLVEREFFGMSILRIEEGGLIARLVFLREFVEAVAHAIGREINLRDGGQGAD